VKCIKIAIIRADIDDAIGDGRRGNDLIPRGKGPANSTIIGVDSVQLVVIRTDIDESVSSNQGYLQVAASGDAVRGTGNKGAASPFAECEAHSPSPFFSPPKAAKGEAFFC
jgi:hypothetical protein